MTTNSNSAPSLKVSADGFTLVHFFSLRPHDVLLMGFELSAGVHFFNVPLLLFWSFNCSEMAFLPTTVARKCR